jgi:hypothetical protein
MESGCGITKQTQIWATKPDKINYQTGGYFLFLGYSYPLKLDNTEVPVRLNNKMPRQCKFKKEKPKNATTMQI